MAPPETAAAGIRSRPLLRALTGPPGWIALSHFILELSNNFLPVLYPLLRESMGLTYEQIGTITLLGGIFGALIQPVFGWIADRFNARRQLIASILWIGLIMGSVGYVDRYWLLLPVVALGALGSAAYHPPGAALAGSVSRRRRGTAMSLFSIGGNLGAAASPLLVGLALTQVGMRGTAVLWPVAIVTAWLLTTALPRVEKRDLKVAAPDNPSHTSDVARPGAWLALGLVILFVAARSWFQGTLMTYLPEWLSSQGRTLEEAGFVLSLLLVSVGAGSFLGGTLSDRFGRVPIVVVSLGSLMPLFAFFLRTDGVPQAVLAAAIGVAIGATFPVSLVMAQETRPEAPGLASSLVMGLGWVPAGLGAWTVGRLADQSTLTEALGTLTLVPLIGVVATFIFAWWWRGQR